MATGIRNRTNLSSLLAGCVACTGALIINATAADPVAFSDGFESPTLDAFWTKRVSNATTTLSSSGQVHAGSQAAQFATTGYGQKDAGLDHTFSQPQYGKASVWVYDQKNYIYFSLMVYNTALGQGAGIGVQDWDYGTYYSVAGKTTYPRTVGWHLFTVEFTAGAFLASIDGQVVFSGPGGVPYDKVTIQLSGPGSGGVVYDDFSFEAAPDPAGLRITGLNNNGQLAWTNGPALTNGLFTIEWAAAPGTNWHSSWGALEAFPVSGAASTVEVPMLYRVKCVTNLFIPCPINGRLNFGVSNAVGGVSTEQITCLNRVKPTAAGGKEYVLLENLVPGGGMGMQLLRSTDSAVYRFDMNTLSESLEFRIAPPGSTWTNYNYEGQWTLKVTVEAIENVTVPAGTFVNCYKFHKQALNYPGTERAEWYEWIKPGLGLVKWVDYWMDASENPPVVHELQSSSFTAP